MASQITGHLLSASGHKWWTDKKDSFDFLRVAYECFAVALTSSKEDCQYSLTGFAVTCWAKGNTTKKSKKQLEHVVFGLAEL